MKEQKFSVGDIVKNTGPYEQCFYIVEYVNEKSVILKKYATAEGKRFKNPTAKINYIRSHWLKHAQDWIDEQVSLLEQERTELLKLSETMHYYQQEEK